MPDDIEPLQRNNPTIALVLSVRIAPPPSRLGEIRAALREEHLHGKRVEMDRRYRAFQLRGDALMLERYRGPEISHAFCWQVARLLREIADEVEA